MSMLHLRIFDMVYNVRESYGREIWNIVCVGNNLTTNWIWCPTFQSIFIFHPLLLFFFLKIINGLSDFIFSEKQNSNYLFLAILFKIALDLRLCKMHFIIILKMCLNIFFQDFYSYLFAILFLHHWQSRTSFLLTTSYNQTKLIMFAAIEFPTNQKRWTNPTHTHPVSTCFFLPCPQCPSHSSTYVFVTPFCW